MKSVSHKYYKECRYPVERGTQIVPKDWSSIFISSLPAGFDDNNKLTHLIEAVLNLGSIKRIDYAKHATTGKPLAFIHFHYWNNTPDVQKFRYDIENLEYLDLCGTHTFFTSSIAANMYNRGNTDSYAGLNNYFENVPNGTFLRMMINKTPISDTVLNIHQIAANADELNKKVIQLTETLESVVNENKLLKEQMQYVMERLLPKPTIYRRFDDENPPTLSLDDLVTDIHKEHEEEDDSIDDNENLSDYDTVYSDSENENNEYIPQDMEDNISHLSGDENDATAVHVDDDSDSESSYPAFHPHEFSEHFSEDIENKVILDTAIIIKDYETIANYFLKYNKCATDQPCTGCVFEEFCDDNNINTKTKNLVGVVLHNMKKSLAHLHCNTCALVSSSSISSSSSTDNQAQVIASNGDNTVVEVRV